MLNPLRIIACDDERPALKNLEQCIQKASPEAILSCFRYPEDVLKFAKDNKIDVAFLDISMPGKKGTELAKALLEMQPNMNIIFVTAYFEYALEAISIHASGYVLKPVKESDVSRELSNLLHKTNNEEKNIYVQTFGNFEVYVNGAPLRFKLAKSKEMFAFLVDRSGASLTRKEIAAALFLDKPYTPQVENYFSKIFKSLLSTLEEAGLSECLIYSHNSYAIKKGVFRCDLYEYQDGELEAKGKYHGEYMSQYEWAIDPIYGSISW